MSDHAIDTTLTTKLAYLAYVTHAQLSSLGFYAACAASPPPPLTLVFGSRALASRVAVFSRLSLLREVAGRSVVREYRARTAEEELRKGAKGGRGGEKMLEEEKSALGALDVSKRRLELIAKFR